AALASASKQTLREIEIVVVNDGSTDGSREIIDRYAQGDDRFVVIHKPNEGYGKAVNVGFDRARGHYILLFESDDFLEPEMCEALYCHALTTSVDIVKSNGFFSFENNVSSPKPLYSASRVGKHGDA